MLCVCKLFLSSCIKDQAFSVNNAIDYILEISYSYTGGLLAINLLCISATSLIFFTSTNLNEAKKIKSVEMIVLLL